VKLSPLCAPAIIGYISPILVNRLTLTPWLYSASELYRPSDRSLSAKLVPTIADTKVSRRQRGEYPTNVFSLIEVSSSVGIQKSRCLCSLGLRAGTYVCCLDFRISDDG
jgi:hypothetical protein